MGPVGRRNVAAALAAWMAFVGTGCAGSQSVRFAEPEGATFVLDGRELGEAPVVASVSRESLHRLTVRAADSGGAVTGNLLVFGSGEGDLPFVLAAEDLSRSILQDRTVYVRMETPGGDLLLWFKARPGGIPDGDDETHALLPPTLRGPVGILTAGILTIALYTVAIYGGLYLTLRHR